MPDPRDGRLSTGTAPTRFHPEPTITMKPQLFLAGLLLLLPSAAFAQNAKLTVVHGIPGLPAPVDVYANGTKLFSFDFNQSRGPLSLPAATYNLEVRLNGSPVLTAPANVQAGKDYTVIAHPKVGSGIALAIFENDIATIPLDKSRVTVRHLADAPAVDVKLTQGATTVATIPNLSNPNQAKAEFAAGDYAASLFAAGTTTKALGPVPLRLDRGIHYLVHAIGSFPGNTLTLFVQKIDINGDGKVSVVHGIPGLPAPVEVFANGNRLFSFDFNQIRGPLSLPPATYALEVRLNGIPVLTGSATVASGKDYTVIAHPKVGGAIALAIFENDVTPIDLGKSRLTVRHLADAPAVDVKLAQNGNFIATIPNLTNPNQVVTTVGIGDYEASIFAAGTATKVLGPAPLRFETGVAYQVHAIGALGTNTLNVLVQRTEVNPLTPLKSQTLGVACNGNLAIDTPTPAWGIPFQLRLTNALPFTFGVVFLSDTTTNWRGVTLPASLAPLGAPGCTLYTGIDFSVTLLTDPIGAASHTLAVPLGLGGYWKPIWFQAAFLSPSNAFGAEFTNAVGVLPNTP